jgi:SP family galactose:H+ symporter-like MFS transporter
MAVDVNPPEEQERKPPPLNKWLWMVGGVIAVAGILFGYDQGVISGAIPGIQDTLGAGDAAIQIITSWVTLGALLGALVAGTMADRFGRKPALLFAGALFAVGAIVEGIAPGTVILVAGRLIVGFAVGVASVAAPLYAAEMAPSRLRGRYISTYQLGITFGIFVAYLVAQLLDQGDWRWMLGLSGIVGIALIIAIIPLPDTPRWYVKWRRHDDAVEALKKVDDTGDPTATLAGLEKDIEDDKQASWAEVFSKRWRTPLLIGIGLAVFQQITGINAIIYYAVTIFKAAGFVSYESSTEATTWAIGGVNVVATLIAVFYVDRLGRKPLLLAGLAGMGTALVVVGIAFLSIPDKPTGGTTTAGIVTLCALVVYIASFAFSLGPVVWTMINEIYPREVRGRMVSVATAFNWFAAFLVAEFFVSLTNWIGQSGTFWMFAAFCLIAFLWIWRYVPETKNKSLEQIQAMFSDRFDEEEKERADGHGPS